ncbi:MAG: polysaccharide deacetylase family protein [Pseudomonadota bacterium]
MHPAMCVTLSWDDGHPLDLRIADMMSRHHLRGTFYVSRTAECGTMSAAQIRELSQTFEVGAHTLSHVVLTQAHDRRAHEEIFGARKWLEDITGKPCSLFCPPSGRYSGRHLRMIEQAGYRAVRTVELLSLDWPRQEGALLSMPTSVQAWSHSTRSYLQNIAKRGSFQNLWRYLAHGRAADWPELSRIIFAEARRHGGVFHLWAHSWEIEGCQAWGRLDDVMRFLTDRHHETSALTNGEVCGVGTLRFPTFAASAKPIVYS